MHALKRNSTLEIVNKQRDKLVGGYTGMFTLKISLMS